MKVVSNAGPLIALGKLGQLGLLLTLYRGSNTCSVSCRFQPSYRAQALEQAQGDLLKNNFSMC